MPPKVRDILKLLHEDGWVLKSQEGSHRHFVHSTKPGKVTVAGHPSQEPPESSYRSILKTGGAKKMNEYVVIFETSPTGWGAYVPDLPGLIATSSTFEETAQLMREALEIHLGSMLEDGDSIPEPTTRVITMQVAVLQHQCAKPA